MSKQAGVSQFLKRSTKTAAEQISHFSLTKGQNHRFRLVNMLVLALLISGSILGTWGTPTVYAQATDQVTTAGRVAVIGINPAPLYATPGGATLETLTPGMPVTLVGRSQDSQWMEVTSVAGHTGWMTAQQLIAFGVDGLPVMAVATTAADKAAVQAVATATEATPALSDTTPISVVNPIVAASTITSTTPATGNAQPVDTATATITACGLNVRAGPGTNYPVITKVSAGQTYGVQARNAASNWVKISLADQQLGWVSAAYVKLAQAVNTLPVSDQVSAVPIVSQPTPTATATNLLVAAEPVVQTASIVPVNRIAPTHVAASSTVGLQGTLVFETSNGGAIYAYNLASGALHQLTSGYDPAISPDGSKVAFTRVGGENGLYVINSDGSNERKIYSGNQTLSSPKWNPDGNWIVFSQVSATYTCYQMGGQCLTRTDLKKRLPPSQANDPDALDKLLKGSDIEVNQNSLWGLARVNVDGQEYRDIAALNSARSPDWSNGGIVYQSADGLQKTADKPDAVNQLVLGEHYVQDPDWQPNSGRIVYQSRQGPHWELFAVNDDGSGEVALTHPEMTLVDQLPSNVAPAWSPDGQHIVFLSNRQDQTYEAGAWRIWVMNADGSNQHPLPINVELDYGYTDEQMVSWGG